MQKSGVGFEHRKMETPYEIKLKVCLYVIYASYLQSSRQLMQQFSAHAVWIWFTLRGQVWNFPLWCQIISLRKFESTLKQFRVWVLQLKMLTI